MFLGYTTQPITVTIAGARTRPPALVLTLSLWRPEALYPPVWEHTESSVEFVSFNTLMPSATHHTVWCGSSRLGTNPLKKSSFSSDCNAHPEIRTTEVDLNNTLIRNGGKKGETMCPKFTQYIDGTAGFKLMSVPHKICFLATTGCLSVFTCI